MHMSKGCGAVYPLKIIRLQKMYKFVYHLNTIFVKYFVFALNGTKITDLFPAFVASSIAFSIQGPILS